jgi:hypothetical protein
VQSLWHVHIGDQPTPSMIAQGSVDLKAVVISDTEKRWMDEPIKQSGVEEERQRATASRDSWRSA